MCNTERGITMSASLNEEFPPAEPATDRTQEICDHLKPDIEKALKGLFTDFKAIEYRKKPEARTNIYLIKIYLGTRGDVHVRVKEELPSLDVFLINLKYPAHDPLVPF